MFSVRTFRPMTDSVIVSDNCVVQQLMDLSDDTAIYACIDNDHIVAKVDRNGRLYVGDAFHGRFTLENSKWVYTFTHEDKKITIRTQHAELYFGAEPEVVCQLLNEGVLTVGVIE